MSFDPFEEQMYASISTLPSEGQGTDQCQGEPARHTSIQGSHSDTMTPAQAYAYAVRTGQDYNHTLHYTIERKQPLRNPPAQPPQLPLSSVNTGAERGGLYAQRLYAGATSSRSSSSLLSSNSPCVSTQPIDRPSPVAPSVPESRPLSRSQHHHRSSSRSPSAFDPSVPRAATQGFNVADLYHSSLPRGDLQSLRIHRSGPASLAAVGSRAEPAPLSAPPLHAPTPLVAYPRFQASVSQTQLPQRSELSSPPVSLVGFPSGRLKHNLSAHDINLSAVNSPLSPRETTSLQASSAIPVPTVYIMTPPRSTTPLSNVAPISRSARSIGRTRNASPSFTLPLERSLLQETTSAIEEGCPSMDDLPPPPPFEPAISSMPSLLGISSPTSSSPSSFQRPSSASPYHQADLPSYTPSVHAISSSPPFGDEKSSTSRLPYRFTTSPHAGPAVDRHALPAVPTPFQPPCMAARSHDNNTILTSPPSTLRSPSPPSPPRSTENLPVVKNSPLSHRETSKPPLVLRTPEPTEHPAEQPSDESPLSLPNPYDQGQDEDSATSPLAPPGISPISPQPSENADDLMDAIENLMVARSS